MHRARKRFGQNFLDDTSIVDRIVQAMRLKRDDAVIEVGPGLGALTLPLLDALDALTVCLLYTSPSPRDATLSRMPSSA